MKIAKISTTNVFIITGQLMDNVIIERICNVDVLDITDTAAAIIKSLNTPKSGVSYNFYITNISPTNHKMTFNGGKGVEIKGDNVIKQGETICYNVYIEDIAVPRVIIRSLLNKSVLKIKGEGRLVFPNVDDKLTLSDNLYWNDKKCCLNIDGSINTTNNCIFSNIEIYRNTINSKEKLNIETLKDLTINSNELFWINANKITLNSKNGVCINSDESYININKDCLSLKIERFIINGQLILNKEETSFRNKEINLTAGKQITITQGLFKYKWPKNEPKNNSILTVSKTKDNITSLEWKNQRTQNIKITGCLWFSNENGEPVGCNNLLYKNETLKCKQIKTNDTLSGHINIKNNNIYTSNGIFPKDLNIKAGNDISETNKGGNIVMSSGEPNGNILINSNNATQIKSKQIGLITTSSNILVSKNNIKISGKNVSIITDNLEIIQKDFTYNWPSSKGNIGNLLAIDTIQENEKILNLKWIGGKVKVPNGLINFSGGFNSNFCIGNDSMGVGIKMNDLKLGPRLQVGYSKDDNKYTSDVLTVFKNYGNCEIVFISGDKSTIHFGDKYNFKKASILYDNNSEKMNFINNGNVGLSIDNKGVIEINKFKLKLNKKVYIQQKHNEILDIENLIGTIVTAITIIKPFETKTLMVKNENVKKDTNIQLTMTKYNGKLSKNGIPMISVDNKFDGFFSIAITNIHPQNNIDEFVKIDYNLN
jgi:hypothetical protein